MRPHLLQGALSVALAMTGCSKPSADDIDKRLSSASSTLQLVGEEHETGHIPDLYVKQILKATDEQLKTQQQDIDRLSPTDSHLTNLRQRKDAVAQQAEALRQRTSEGSS